MKVTVMEGNQLDGIGIVLTEMALQHYGVEEIARIISPMGITADEIHWMLEQVDPDWEQNEVGYLIDVYLAWAEAQDE